MYFRRDGSLQDRILLQEGKESVVCSDAFENGAAVRVPRAWNRPHWRIILPS
jgi:hypothetical protein